MRPIEIEAIARTVIDRATKGQPVEDMRVELKSEWPDANRAARQIAGISNAALGDPVLWLIGVDEKAAKVVGAALVDVANWWTMVKSCFDGPAPLLHHVSFECDGETVIALLFQTDLAPYVVKNPAGGQISREVPWREGARTDSATRAQLVLIMAPLIRAPRVELVNASVELKVSPGQGGRVHEVRWKLESDLYVTQRQDQQVSLAVHKTSVEVRYGDDLVANLPSISFQLVPSTSGSTFNAIALTGPNYFKLRASAFTTVNHALHFPDDSIAFSVDFEVPNCDRNVFADCEVKVVPGYEGQPEQKNSSYDKCWRFPEDTPGKFIPQRRSLQRMQEEARRRRGQ